MFKTNEAHCGNLLISLSGSKQPKDTTTPTSNRPSTLSGGQLCSGSWFCCANLFTGTSANSVTTSRDSTTPSLLLLQTQHGGQLARSLSKINNDKLCEDKLGTESVCVIADHVSSMVVVPLFRSPTVSLIPQEHQ